MGKKAFACVGIEYDKNSIRAAKIRSVRQGKANRDEIENLQELKGEYARDEELAEGLRAITEKIGFRARDRAVVGVSGRQVFVTEVKYRDLPRAEMEKALRVEIRKNLTFDATGSALDYQVVDKAGPDEKPKPTIMVTAVAKHIIDLQLRVLGRAGVTPWAVDVLPMAIANSYWIAREEKDAQKAHTLFHFSPDTCTAVIDGATMPFYSRSIYFSSEEVYEQTDRDIAYSDRTKRLETLGEELQRSISYYRKTSRVSDFGEAVLVGNHGENDDLSSLIHEKLGFEVTESNLLERLGSKAPAPAGKYDVALALALRGND